MEETDLVVVGAGIHGLVSASTYRQLHPTAKILILDGAPSIGGPWASHRIFPGLKTNNLLGMYEHPDFPMDEEKFGVKRGEHIPGEKMFQYLNAMIDHFEIRDCLRMNTMVDTVRQAPDGWNLRCISTQSKATYDLKTAKLIIAIGRTNKPSMPRYPTSPTFTPPIIHSKDFPTHYPTIVQPNSTTLVIGGAKSAWDISYACASQPNSTVTLLIRPSGNGPVWMTPSHVTPLGLWLEKLVFTRFFGFMSPCPWGGRTGIEGWMRGFFQHTWLGRLVTGAFWKILGDDAVKLNGLMGHRETRKLVPWRGAFEVGNALSIHNYPTNFFDLVKEGRVKVVFDEVKSFGEGKEVLLGSGEKIEVDAVVCATGWEIGNSVKFEPEGLEKKLGLPTTAPPSPSEAVLIARTEASLYTTYPYLRTRDTSRTYHPDPSLRYTQVPNTAQQPYRLYRFIVPPAFLSNRSIAFSGALHCLGTFPCAYLQALWISAYFSDEMTLPAMTEEQVRERVYRDTQYGAIRGAMSYGRVVPDLVFDSLPYFDGLVGDLGLRAKRKGGGVREVVRGYGPEDYRGLVGEWVESKEVEEGKKVV